MNVSQRLEQMRRRAGGGLGASAMGYEDEGVGPRRPRRSPVDGLGMESQSAWGFGPLWQSLLGRGVEMAQVEEEVAAEQFGRVAIVGPDQDLNRRLLSRLRQHPPVAGREAICREGFFTLVCMPGVEPAGQQASSPLRSPTCEWLESDLETPEILLAAAAEHDLLIYLFPTQAGWQAHDAHWCARLRATHVPLLPVGATAAGEGSDEPAEGIDEALRSRLGVRPALIHLDPAAQWEAPGSPAPEDPEVIALVRRMLELRPRLAVPLAQEIPACRNLMAQRVIRSGAFATLLLGSEPIPLLDLPLHVAAQWRVALQLAAIYGRPGLDYRSRELAGTVVVNLVFRHLAQQALKLVPFVGWLLSGLLSGASTWLLGQALVRYYQEERVISIPAWRLPSWKRPSPRDAVAQVRRMRIWPRPRGSAEQSADVQTIRVHTGPDGHSRNRPHSQKTRPAHGPIRSRGGGSQNGRTTADPNTNHADQQEGGAP